MTIIASAKQLLKLSPPQLITPHAYIASISRQCNEALIIESLGWMVARVKGTLNCNKHSVTEQERVHLADYYK